MVMRTLPACKNWRTIYGLLMTYFAARFGVLGVYVSGRTREKQTAMTEDAPSIVGSVLKAVARKR